MKVNRSYLLLVSFFVLTFHFFIGAFPCEASPLTRFWERPERVTIFDLWSDPDPFRILEDLPLALDKGALAAADGMVTPPAAVDWKETPEGHVIKLDVPGLKKEELRVEIEENRVLRICGERKEEEEQKGTHWHRIERSHGKFWRRLRLPENADIDSIKAKLENGVLMVSFSKLSPDSVKGPKAVGITDTSAGGEQPAKLDPAKQEL